MSDIDPSKVQWDDARPSSLVGMPANGFQYSAAQMAQLNAARDALRAEEATGVYGPGGTGNPTSVAPSIDPSQVQWDQGASAGDRVQAAGAAVNRAALANIPGMPVDFALNLYDLAKAGAGSLGRATGFLSPDQMPGLTDRSKIPGSSEYLANLVRKTGVVIDPNKPNDEASKLLYAGGQGATAALLGGPSVSNAIAGGVGQAASQGVADLGGGPTAQVLAAFAPALGSPLGRAAANRSANLRSLQAQNAQRDAVIQQAQSAGYAFPPSQVDLSGSSLINSALEKLGGKAATQQAASLKNAGVTQNLIKGDFGIAPDAPINPDVLENIRNGAGSAYEAVKNTPSIIPDPAFAATARQIFAPYEAQLAQFPQSGRNTQIENLQNDVNAIANQPAVNPAPVIEQIKQLRTDGFANKNKPNDPATNAVGRVQLSTANALEDLIDRNLAATGNDSLLQDYRDARTLIAKTYSAQNAMNPVTGNVDANVLAKALKKGKPLSGGMLTAAQTASVAPQAMRDTNSAAGISKLDATMSIGSVLASIASHNPWVAMGALAPVGASAARAGILSGPYQRVMAQPNYSTGLLSRLFENTANPTLAGLLAPYAAATSQP